MKLSTILLTLATATSVYSKSVNETTFSEKDMAQDDAYDNERAPFLKHVGKECFEDLTKDNIYIDCFGAPTGRINLNNVNEKCALFDTDKCKKFYEDPSAVAPKCANDEAFKKLLPYLKPEFSGKNILCLRTPENEMCPVPRKIITQAGYSPDDIKTSCKSAACRESLLEYCTSGSKYTDDFWSVQMDEATFKEFKTSDAIISYDSCISILNSQDCISQAKDDKATSKIVNATNVNEFKSGSIVNAKSSSSILFTIIVLLAYLF
ncbi:hypothetical protein BCR32DRAFT_328356 [Anaeromyces robustus]|uniref:Uncharacterized protein n=1 Tax=Anaeromyces robustus TaxID=1754192 RepID=A0A1Y1WZG2_9FUNG|nr:hypothetical protein BCR32DRAFT_328356 [Anaeromyces robustus]|eukprot:ORX78893.1 hypothetical protein BCR32DRAFT_328356 [Anaeromyces robustus]